MAELALLRLHCNIATIVWRIPLARGAKLSERTDNEFSPLLELSLVIVEWRISSARGAWSALIAAKHDQNNARRILGFFGKTSLDDFRAGLQIGNWSIVIRQVKNYHEAKP